MKEVRHRRWSLPDRFCFGVTAISDGVSVASEGSSSVTG